MSIESLKSATAGQDLQIAITVCGLQDITDKEKHQPCPICGGHDRFWYKDSLRLFTCRQCGLCVDIIGLVQVTNRCECSEACELIEAFLGNSVECIEGGERREKRGETIVEVLCKTEYKYCDTTGKELYRICRKDFLDEAGKKGKKFSPLWTDDNGEKQFNEREQKVPYNLHRLGLAKTIFVVEGEKTADCLNEMFRLADDKFSVATTSQGGSGRGYLWENFIEEYPALKAKPIRILPDNDDPGRKYAQAVSNAFVQAGAQNVKIVTIPKLSEKGDFCDWWEDGTEDSPEKAQAARSMLIGWCRDAAQAVGNANQSPNPKSQIPVAKPTFKELLQLQQDEQHKEFAQNYAANLITASELSEQDLPPVNWVIDGLMPTGVTLFAGQSKIGKSWLLLQAACQIANGETFLGKYRCRQHKTLYLALEDNQRRIHSRMHMLGMKSQNLLIDTENKVTPTNLRFVLDVLPDVKVVFIDTIGRFAMENGLDNNSYSEVTELLGKIHNEAKERDIAILLCTHTRKNGNSANDDPFDSIIGSKANLGVVDTAWKLDRQRQSTEGMFHITGRDVVERSFEVSHNMCWHWTTNYEETEYETSTEEVTEWHP